MAVAVGGELVALDVCVVVLVAEAAVVVVVLVLVESLGPFVADVVAAGWMKEDGGRETGG